MNEYIRTTISNFLGASLHALIFILQRLADYPEERAAMSIKALNKIQDIGGWNAYGEQAMTIYKEVLQ